MEKKIKVIAFVIGVLGLAFGIALVSEPLQANWVFQLISIFCDLRFGWWGFASWTAFIMPVLLLIGVAFYHFSKYRETRMLRFSLSILFLLRLIWGLVSLVYIIKTNVSHFAVLTLLWSVLSLAYTGFLIVFSWKALHYFRNQKTLDTFVNTYDGFEVELHPDASNWTRLFHHITDLLVCVLIFPPVVLDLVLKTPFLRHLLEVIETATSDRIALLVVCIVFRSIYYLLFETLLSATPAKLLSETRIITADGGKPGFASVATRTFSRFVPLEPLSFFSRSGWHDRWSSTEVVTEKRTGIHGGYYFILIPAAMLTFSLAVVSVGFYKKWKEEKAVNAGIEKEIDDIHYAIDHLTTYDVIFVSALRKYENKWLKVESVTPKTVTFSVIETDRLPLDETGSFTYDIEKPEVMDSIYRNYAPHFRKLSLSIDKLHKAVVTKEKAKRSRYKYQEKVQATGGLLLNDANGPYLLEKIQPYFMPVLRVDNYSSQPNMHYISVDNVGTPGEIIDVERISGDIKVVTDYKRYPTMINGSSNADILFDTEAEDPEYALKITIRGGDGRNHKWKLVSDASKRSVEWMR